MVNSLAQSPKLKIWILEIGEPLPIEQGVRLHRYGLFSKWLASQGHSVTWWTSSFSHAPKKNFVGEDCEILKDAVHLKFIFGKGYKRNISLARIRHQADFAKRFLEQASRVAAHELPDVIMAPIPTIDGACAAIDFARKKKIAVIADIRDLWPDEIRDLAPSFARGLAELALFRAYSKLRKVCHQATAICGVSQSYLAYGLRHTGRRRATDLNLGLDFVFPLGYSTQAVSHEKRSAAEHWYASLKVPSGAFVVCFFGTIGKFFDLKTVLGAARELGPDYQFILGGDGSSLEGFKREAHDLRNVIFTGWLDASQIQEVMRHSKVGLAPYARDAKMSLPNKPFEYMSAGLAVVSSIQYELKEILASSRAGLTYNADSVSDLSSALRRLHGDPKLPAEFGVNARSLFEREYTTEKVFASALLRIQKVVEVWRAK